MTYAILAVVATFSGGVYIGWWAAVSAMSRAVQNGSMQQLIDDYDEKFGTPCNSKE